MSHDASDAPPPTETQMVRWLRALADAVERDPALAAQMSASMADATHTAETQPIPTPAMLSSDEATTTLISIDEATTTPTSNNEATSNEVIDDETPVFEAPSAPLPPLSQPPAEPETIVPTLRHTRRSSRYGAPSVAGRPAELGTGVPDPFALYASVGEDGLRHALGAVRVGTLRAIIRTHALDPQGKLAASATEKRLITAIIVAAKRGSGKPVAKDAKPTRRKSASKAKSGKSVEHASPLDR